MLVLREVVVEAEVEVMWEEDEGVNGELVVVEVVVMG
jgi:hypothetical protein